MKRIVTAACCLFISGLAQAQQNSQGWYLGGNWGKSKVDTGITAVTATLDEKDSGYKVFLGHKFSDIFSAEFHYTDAGEASLSGNNGSTFRIDGTLYEFTANNAKISASGTSYGLSGLVYLPVNETVKPFARLGLHRWENKFNVTSSDYNGSVKFTGTDPVYGVGVDIAITKSVSARLEHEIYKADDDKVSFTSVGVFFSF